jgi:HK97 family phage major capsid protein
MAEMTVSDLRSMIKDELSGAVKSIALESAERAADSAKKAERDGNPTAALAAMARGSEAPPPSDPANDPLKGKGLAFVRAVKALFSAQTSHRDVGDVVKGWVDAGHRHYTGTADDARAVHDWSVRALGEGTFTGGGALLTPAVGEFIELLYPQTVAYALGANPLSFPGQIDLGRMNSGATAAYVSEGATISVSQPAFGKITLTKRKLAAVVPVSNELLRNPSISADMLVRADLLQQIALKRDLMFFRGTGSNGEPKGVKNWIVAGNTFASAGTTTANKIADLLKMIRLVDESNVPLTAGGWVFSPRSFWALVATLDAQTRFVFADMLAQGQLFGFKFGKTTQIPNTLGGGSDTEVYFGAFNDAILGTDSATGLAVELFPNGSYHDGTAVQSGVSNDQSVIRAIEANDVALRHNNTFSVLTGVQWT